MTLAPEPLAGRMHLRPGVAPPAAIHSTRPDLLPRLAPGRRAGEMPALLGAVFTLCAAAHRLTAIAAIRAARGEPADDPAAAAQTLRLATAREQILRIDHDWPRLLRQDGRSDDQPSAADQHQGAGEDLGEHGAFAGRGGRGRGPRRGGGPGGGG